MDINIYMLSIVLRKRRGFLNQQYQPFGSALKRRRKEKRMTLVEACKNICSISYFSKVENNQIIPSPNKKMLLQERFDIPDQYTNETMFTEELNLWIDYLLYKDHKIKKKLEAIPYEDNHYGWMHKFLCDIHFELKNIELSSLFDYFDQYSDQAIFVLLYSYADLSYRKTFYHQAYDVLEVLDMDIYENEKIKLLYSHMMCQTSFACHKTLRLIESSKTVETLSIKLETYYFIKQCKAMLNAYQAMYTKEPNYDSIDSQYISHVMYMRGHPVSDHIKLPLNEVTIMLLFKDNHPLLREYMNRYNKPGYFLIRWIEAHLTHEDEEMFALLRNEMPHEVMSKYGYEFVHFIFTQSSQFFEQTNFYKEATQIMKKGLITLNQLRTE